MRHFGLQDQSKLDGAQAGRYEEAEKVTQDYNESRRSIRNLQVHHKEQH